MRALFFVLGITMAAAALAAGDARRGAILYRSCVACHALEPGLHRTGPSLAGIWGRKAGAIDSFPRYSAVLRSSGIVWNGQTLDAWLQEPARLVPGNYMSFAGIRDERARADLIAFLRATSDGSIPREAVGGAGPDLKTAPRSALITAIRRCGDSYFVTNATGDTRPYWEFNLRFKTDSSASGPAPGRPVMVGAGMQGDRAQLVFAHPKEISGFIVEKCEP